MAVTLAEIRAEDLASLLRLFSVDVSSWGTGESRTVGDFLHELRAGESFIRIDKDGIARVLRIVKMCIESPEADTKVLVEDYQILPDGRRKNRNQTPGGKIGANEEPEEALKRELHEELGGLLKEDDYEVRTGWVCWEEKPSKSYPTLRSLYEVHQFRITLKPGVVIPDGYEVIDTDGKTKLVFRWAWS